MVTNKVVRVSASGLRRKLLSMTSWDYVPPEALNRLHLMVLRWVNQRYGDVVSAEALYTMLEDVYVYRTKDVQVVFSSLGLQRN